MIFDAAPIIV